MEDLDFKHLKRLYTLKLVIETGSIKRAAVRANVTSSAISQSLTGLEDQLGRKLLLRKKENILPTEYGRQLLTAAEPAFDVCAELQRSLAPSCAVLPKIDWLDFAASDSLACDVLPSLVKRLRLRLPAIRLKVKTGRSAALTCLVKKGELCMALVEENEELEGSVAFPIAEERLGFYAAASDEVRKWGEKTFEKLGVGHIAAGPEGHPRHITKFLATLGRAQKPTLTSESYDVLRAAAAAGAVVAVLPVRVAKRIAGDLLELKPPGPPRPGVGLYKIYLASEAGCTVQENEFLAHEIKCLMQG